MTETVRCNNCPAEIRVEAADEAAGIAFLISNGWTFDEEREWLCPVDSHALPGQLVIGEDVAVVPGEPGRLYVTVRGVRKLAGIFDAMSDPEALAAPGDPGQFNDGRVCRICGCSNNRACVGIDDESRAQVTCFWTTADLCSRCSTIDIGSGITWQWSPDRPDPAGLSHEQKSPPPLKVVQTDYPLIIVP